jgi:hypothetical protein
MPPHERVGTHDRQQLPPSDASRQQDKGDSGRVIRAPRSDVAVDVAGELLPKKQVLGRELRAGLKDQSQQPQKVGEQGEGRSDDVTAIIPFRLEVLRNRGQP